MHSSDPKTEENLRQAEAALIRDPNQWSKSAMISLFEAGTSPGISWWPFIIALFELVDEQQKEINSLINLLEELE